MATSIEQQGQALIAAFESLTITENHRAKWLSLFKSYKGRDPFDLSSPSAVTHLTQLREEDYMFNQQSTIKKPYYTAKEVARYWRKRGINPLNQTATKVIVSDTPKQHIVPKLQVRHFMPPADKSPKVLEACSKCSNTENASNFSLSGEMRKGHWYHRNANQWQPCGRCAGSGYMSEESVERYSRYLTRVRRKKVMNITFNDFTQNPVH